MEEDVVTLNTWPVFLEYLCNNWVTWLNLIISLFVLLHNGFIVKYLYHNLGGIPQLLFFCMGLADLSAALATLTLSVSSILFYNNMIGQLPFQRAIIVFSVLFPAASASSRTLNVVLTVMKTISITSITRAVASSGMRTRSVVTSFLFSILWLSLTTSDVILTWQIGVAGSPAHYQDRGIVLMLLTSSLIGRETLGHLIAQICRLTGHDLDQDGLQKLIEIIVIVVVTIHYLIPTFLTFVGMILQVRSIRSSLQPNSNSNDPNAKYINRTIFLVTLLFCVCNSIYCVSIITTFVLSPGNSYLWKRSFSSTRLYLAFIRFSEFTMPLLNAALFPVIIILRKRSFRERYRNWFRNAFERLSGVVGWCGGVVHGFGVWSSEEMTARRSDNEDVP